MIGPATLDYTTLCRTFHNTLAKDCTSELEKLAEIKQKPYIAPNLNTSWVYKKFKWEFTFGNERMTQKMYKILEFLRQKIIAIQTTQSDQTFKLHYTFRPLNEATEGMVFVPNEQTMTGKYDGIDAEMFDTVILPCLQKTLAKLKINLDFHLGKPSSLETYSYEQVRFGVQETVIDDNPTIETTALLKIEDGFTKVNRQEKKELQITSAVGKAKESPEKLKIVQVWHRQHGKEVPENIQKAIKDLNIK